MKNQVAQHREKYLFKVYELTKGNLMTRVIKKEFESQLGFSNEEVHKIYHYLKNKGFVKPSTFGTLNITICGIDEIERIMELQYKEQEHRVLQKLVENGVNKYINDNELASLLSISKEELDIFLSDFCDKKWIGLIVGGTIQLYPAGVTAFYNSEVTNASNRKQAGRDFYETIIHSNNSNNQIGGQDNVQNAQININPEFDNAIRSIIDLINTSSLTNFKKEDLITDIERIKQLSELSPSPDLVEHAKSKIDYLGLAVKGADIALKVAPHIETLTNYFENLIRLPS